MIRTDKARKRRPFWITVAILVLLILFSHRNPETGRLPSNLFNMVLSPVNRLFYSASRSLQDVYDHLFGPKATRAELDRLTLENQALKDEVRTMRNVIADAPYLKEEYALQHAAEHMVIPAEVTMSDPSPTFVRFTINKGTKDGVQEGDIVVQGVQNASKNVVSGLIGQVTEAGLNYAKVSTILDQSHNISILFPSSKKYGIINNRDAERFYGYLLDAQTDVPVGEEIVTSGVGGRYPRGLYLGVVSEVKLAEDGLTKTVSITPAVDFSKLYRVLVVPKNRLAEQEANESESTVQSSETDSADKGGSGE